MPYIPAAPGTLIIDLDTKTHPQPVVGWSITEGGQVAFPVVLGPFDGFRSGMAFRALDKSIYDPVWKRRFDNEDDWRAEVAAKEPYIPGKVPGVSGKDGKAPPTMTQRTSAAAPAKSNPPRGKDEPAPTGRPPKDLDIAPVGLIVMGTKTFKGKSFWRYIDEGYDFVFVVEGGSPLPNDSCATKITRDDYFAARKVVPEMALPEPGAADPDEPELPMGEPEGDEDDDGTDMV